MYNVFTVDGNRPKPIMRRGVLMTMLQQNALTLPLWIGKPGEKSVSCIIFRPTGDRINHFQNPRKIKELVDIPDYHSVVLDTFVLNGLYRINEGSKVHGTVVDSCPPIGSSSKHLRIFRCNQKSIGG